MNDPTFSNRMLSHTLAQFHGDLAYFTAKSAVASSTNDVEVAKIFSDRAEEIRQKMLKDGYFDPDRLFQPNADQTYKAELTARRNSFRRGYGVESE
jgi:hypothetical protein